MYRSNPATVTLWEAGSTSTRSVALLGEEPLSIRVEGKPYAVVMRTPGEEIAHAAGFSLGEGIIDSAADCSSTSGWPRRPSRMKWWRERTALTICGTTVSS